MSALAKLSARSGCGQFDQLEGAGWGQGDIEHPAADVRLAAGVGAGHHIGADEMSVFMLQILYNKYCP
jgi:hypothetical protein